MLPISLAERIPKVCDRRNSSNDFLERSADSRERIIRTSVIPASPRCARACPAQPVKMRLAALLCHGRSWIQGSRFRKQLFRFVEAFQSFRRAIHWMRIPVATMSPANCLRASEDPRTILGASLSILWSAHKPRTEPPACSRRPAFSSAEVSTGSFPRASFQAPSRLALSLSKMQIPVRDQPRERQREIDRQSGQRESNPHGQLGRLELYH
jgi:hypothetical protein